MAIALNTLRFFLTHPLTRSHPLESLGRYARWQVASRLAPGPIAVDYVDGARLLVRPGMKGATGNVYAGLHEFDDMSFVLHALRAHDLFLDVGANVGAYTVLAAKAVGASVIAFEPVAAAFRAFQDNIALNGISDRVQAHQVCVGAKAGFAMMTTGLDTVNHVLVGEAATAQSARVPMVSIDDIVQGRKPFMMKLDVEGYELEVLRGATETLSSPELQCVLMEINDSVRRYGRTESEFAAALEQRGFTSYGYAPAERLLHEPRKRAGAANVIFVRDRALVQERLRSAPFFNVLGSKV